MNGQEFELGVLEVVRKCRKNTFAAHFVWLTEIANLLAARSCVKLPNHQKIVSSCWQDSKKCDEENDCWKVVELAMSGIGVGMLEGVVTMMVTTEVVKGKESVVRFRLQKT